MSRREALAAEVLKTLGRLTEPGKGLKQAELRVAVDCCCEGCFHVALNDLYNQRLISASAPAAVWRVSASGRVRLGELALQELGPLSRPSGLAERCLGAA